MRKRLLVLMILLISITSLSLEHKIVDISVVGNQEVPAKVIISKMVSKVGDNYSTGTMVSDFQRVKSLKYIEETKIFPKLENNTVKLVVEVKEKENARELLIADNIVPVTKTEKIDKSLIVNSVDIYGNIHVTTEEILEKVNVKVGSFFSKKDVLMGQTNLINTGKFRSIIPEVYRNGDGVAVQYTVTENQIITGIKIEGTTIYGEEELKALMKVEPGKLLNIQTLKEDKDRLLKKYHEAGYTLAKIINMDLDADMQLVITFSEGKIKGVEYHKMITKQRGNRRKKNDTELKTEGFVIERELELKEGAIYNKKDFDQSVKNLMRSGAFKNIKAEYKSVPGDPDSVKVVILIDEERTAMLQGAISYGSAVGLVGSLSIKDTNYRGRGQEVGFTYEQSNHNYTSASLSFRDPWIKGTDFVSWGWSIYRQQDQDGSSEAHYDNVVHGGGINIGKGLNRYLRFELGLKLENIKEGDNKKQKTQIYNYTSITPAFIYDTRNNYLNATSGHYIRFAVEFGQYFGTKLGNSYPAKDPGITGKNDTFTKATIELRKYHQGLFKKNTMAYRLLLGIGTDTVKYQQLYASGGANSLRGFRYGWLRGQKQAVVNIENRTELNDVLGFVLFYDIGRSWYNGKSSDSGVERSRQPLGKDLKQSAGFGLRIKTPIGPIRLDFGFPINDKEEHGMEFFFNMGQMF